MVGRVDVALKGSAGPNQPDLRRRRHRRTLETVVIQGRQTGLIAQSEQLRKTALVSDMLQTAFDEIGERLGGTWT